MTNLNKETMNKQTKLALTTIVIAGLAGGAGYYFIFDDTPAVVQEKKAPELAGVISQTFDDKYTKDSIRSNNAQTSSLELKLDGLFKKIEEKDRIIYEMNSKFESENKKLRDQLISFQNQITNLKPNQGNTVNLDVPFNDNSSLQIDKDGSIKQITPPLYTRKINSVSLNSNLMRVNNDLPYVPSGSFAIAKIIEGAEANASVTGNNNTNPIQFRITGKVQMPNDEEFDLIGCFVTAEVYGDISSERGEVRTHNISCKLNGKTIDMPFQGHVAFMGKNGIKGIPVMRNGKIIAWAGASGFLSELGSGVQSASTTVVGVGASNKPSTGDVITSALGGGFEKTASTLSQYYIKRAEQYHPIIDIGAGNEVTVMFQQGFQLEYKDFGNKHNENDLIDKGMSNEKSLNTVAPVDYSYFNQNQQSKPQITRQSDVEKTVNQDNNLTNGANGQSLDDTGVLSGIHLEDFIN